MRKYVDLGRDDRMFIDPELIIAMVPVDDPSSYGTIVFIEGVGPTRTMLDIDTCYARLTGGGEKTPPPRLVS